LSGPPSNFGEGLIAEEVSDLQEDWMKRVDRVLDASVAKPASFERLYIRSDPALTIPPFRQPPAPAHS